MKWVFIIETWYEVDPLSPLLQPPAEMVLDHGQPVAPVDLGQQVDVRAEVGHVADKPATSRDRPGRPEPEAENSPVLETGVWGNRPNSPIV